MSNSEVSDRFRGQAEPLLTPFNRRWVVERTFAWLKGFQAIRTRYTGRGSSYLALVQFACALILSRRIEAAFAQAYYVRDIL